MSAYGNGAIPEYAFTEHEHREFVPALNRIHDVASADGSLTSPDLMIALLEIVDWCQTVLEPHAKWEDRWLYSEFDRVAGTPWATKLMRHEHVQIREQIRRVAYDHEMLVRGSHTDRDLTLRGHLFALEALLRAHMEREERFLIPLLLTNAPVTTGAAVPGQDQA